jgi:GNAT superfamily N-acetyltransferase
MSTGPPAVVGPEPISLAELPALNTLFSEAFSERYRRDGMAGVRVPPLNPPIWRYAIDCAGLGAMLWRDTHGKIAAFNLSHVSGTEGWMGPLAVREEMQGRGLGRRIVSAGIEHLRRAGCRTVGLETMPRTMENIGFYARLGFVPSSMTITITMEAFGGDAAMPELLSTTGALARAELIAECARLTDRVLPGSDYTREIECTLRHALGDLALLRDAQGAVSGFALFHDVPLVEGRSREEMRALKVVLAEESDLPRLATLLRAQARRSSTLRVALRMQGEYGSAFAALVRVGARVRWTDLRMILAADGTDPLPRVSRGLALSNWEI